MPTKQNYATLANTPSTRYNIMNDFLERTVNIAPTAPSMLALDLNLGLVIASGGVEFPFDLFTSPHNVEDFDSDAVEINDEGNASGELFIYFNTGEIIAICFENFSPLVCDYNAHDDVTQLEILEALLEDIHTNVNFG